MTAEEMIAYAQRIASGGQVKRGELITFMRALLAESGTMAPAEPAAVEPFQNTRYVQITSTGKVHVTKEANQTYTRPEAYALAQDLLRAASSSH